jgi:hypothetical protein
LSGLGRAAEQVQKGVIPNKARGEELATQQFNAAKKEQVSWRQVLRTVGTKNVMYVPMYISQNKNRH